MPLDTRVRISCLQMRRVRDHRQEVATFPAHVASAVWRCIVDRTPLLVLRYVWVKVLVLTASLKRRRGVLCTPFIIPSGTSTQHRTHGHSRQRARQMNRLNDRVRPVGGAQTLCGRPAAAITNPTGWTVLPLSRFPRYYSLPVAPSRLKCNTVSVVAQLITVDSDNFIVIALSTMMYCVHCL